MRLGRWAVGLGAFGAVLALGAGAVGVTTVVVQPDPKPTAIVALGDSAISGEGAGDYEPGTDESGNFCHRSIGALVHRTGLGVDASINLACSGAKTANLVRGGRARSGEPPQAEQLSDLAKQYDVEVVVVQVGANDEIDFAGTVRECIVQFAVPFLDGCRNTVGPEWDGRVATSMARLELVLADVLATMADAGYEREEWDLIVQSYASPVTERVESGSWLGRLIDGCPFQRADLAWGRTVAVPGIAAGMAQVAEQADVRFLDLARATEGREACSDAVPDRERWVVPVDIEVRQLRNGFGTNVVQESFHPNALGHAAIGACLGEFVRSSQRAGACLLGPDQQLHPVSLAEAAASAPDAEATVAAAEREDERNREADAKEAADAYEADAKAEAGAGTPDDGRG